MLLRSSSSYRKIRPKFELIWKTKKYYNIGYHHTLKLEKSISNGAIIALLGLKTIEILWIVTIFSNCIIHKVVKCSFKISYWLFNLLLLPIITKRQYKSWILLLLHSLLLKTNLILSITYKSIILPWISKYCLKILRNGWQL